MQRNFDKSYSTPAIEAKRRALWEAAVNMIDKHNQEYKEGKHTYWMEENHLADMVSLFSLFTSRLCFMIIRFICLDE